MEGLCAHKELQIGGRTLPFAHLLQTDSTNLRIKEAVRQGEILAPFLLLADRQSMGRGRLGRSFVSPEGGLYMSLLLRPAAPWEAGRVTLAAAVAVCRAIEELTGLFLKIKWVNDLFLHGKKVCGILAEGVGEMVIIGIGVNLVTPPGGFPHEAGPAGALDAGVDRFALAERISAHLLDDAERLHSPAILADYRARMPLVGRDISYTERGIEKHARVLGVAEDGGLMVSHAAGIQVLRSGEVSLGSAAFSDLE